MSESGVPEGGLVDPGLLAMDLPGLRALADRMYGGGAGPLELAAPSGEAPVRTASGRPVDVAMTRGPLPLGAEPGPASSTPEPEGSPGSGPTVQSIDPRLLELLGVAITSGLARPSSELVNRQIEESMAGPGTLPPSAGQEPLGPPTGYRPPQDASRDPVTVFRRLLAMAVPALENALPSSRERSLVKTQLDLARLWFEEAVRVLKAEDEVLAEMALQEPPPR